MTELDKELLEYNGWLLNLTEVGKWILTDEWNHNNHPEIVSGILTKSIDDIVEIPHSSKDNPNEKGFSKQPNELSVADVLKGRSFAYLRFTKETDRTKRRVISLLEFNKRYKDLTGIVIDGYMSEEEKHHLIKGFCPRPVEFIEHGHETENMSDPAAIKIVSSADDWCQGLNAAHHLCYKLQNEWKAYKNNLIVPSKKDYALLSREPAIRWSVVLLAKEVCRLHSRAGYRVGQMYRAQNCPSNIAQNSNGNNGDVILDINHMPKSLQIIGNAFRNIGDKLIALGVYMDLPSDKEKPYNGNTFFHRSFKPHQRKLIKSHRGRHGRRH